MAGAVISAEPLLALAQRLDIQSELPDVERRDRIHHTFREIASDAIRAVTVGELRAVVSEYGDAVRVDFLKGEQVELSVTTGTSDATITSFQEGASGAYDVVLWLDKQPLASAWESQDRRVALYFFGAALRSWFRRGIQALETELWSDNPSPLLLVILDTTGALVGSHLVIIGNDELHRINDIWSSRPTTALNPEQMREARDRYISWDLEWTKNLTPAHFSVSGTSSDEELTRLIGAQAVKLAVLYTCDRARSRRREGGLPEIQAEYRGQQHVAVISIDEREPLPTQLMSALPAIHRLVDWTYHQPSPTTGSAGDRLPFVQTRVAQALEGRPQNERFDAFLVTMPHLLEGLEWHWKAFIEGKVSQYLDRVRDLESLVGDTAVKFADQTGELVKALSESILAAVAALIGSFLAAAFKDPFNATLFRIGMVSYAIYVLIFPGGLGLLSNARRYVRSKKSFESRLQLFRESLYPDKVSGIVGDRIEKAGRGYWAWLISTAFLFVVIAAVVIAAAWKIPSIVASGEIEQQQQSTREQHVPGDDPHR